MKSLIATAVPAALIAMLIDALEGSVPGFVNFVPKAPPALTGHAWIYGVVEDATAIESPVGDHASDFDSPGVDGSAPEPVSGLGLEANVRELIDGTFDVIVRVANGWFSVNSPDRESAVAFALRAIERVAG